MATHGDDSLHDAGIPVSHSYTQTPRGKIEAAARAALNTQLEEGMTHTYVASLVRARITSAGFVLVGNPTVAADLRSVAFCAIVEDCQEGFDISL